MLKTRPILTPRQSFALQNFATPLGKGVTPPSQANNLIGGVINKRVESILSTLDEIYPYDGKCFLDYNPKAPWQLLFATILSAQCTDDCVNKVTPKLFEKFPTLSSFATAELAELEKIIYPTGFFRAKSKHLQLSANRLLSEFGGELPQNITDLTTLSGVGRKTANVVLGHIFGIPGIVVDTHVKRVSYRLGLTDNSDPVKIELDLIEILPKSHWIRYNQQVITHGRQVCVARNPKCMNCKLYQDCERKNQ